MIFQLASFIFIQWKNIITSPYSIHKTLLGIFNIDD